MSSITSTIGGLLGGAAGSQSGPASVGSYYPNLFQNSQSYQNLLGQIKRMLTRYKTLLHQQHKILLTRHITTLILGNFNKEQDRQDRH